MTQTEKLRQRIAELVQWRRLALQQWEALRVAMIAHPELVSIPQVAQARASFSETLVSGLSECQATDHFSGRSNGQIASKQTTKVVDPADLPLPPDGCDEQGYWTWQGVRHPPPRSR